jgi:hypothetical protein
MVLRSAFQALPGLRSILFERRAKKSADGRIAIGDGGTAVASEPEPGQNRLGWTNKPAVNG